MAGAEDLARGLVAYDERLALEVLGLLSGKLGGTPAWSPAEAAEYLADPEQARLRSLMRLDDVGSSPASTAEWKSEFGHSERLRRFALALAESLR